MICVFCGKKGASESIGHIVPESLGGAHSPVGAPGVTCDKCNYYFGQKVEGKALGSFPFNIYRVFVGVPSKKGSLPSIEATIGAIKSTGRPGTLVVTPRNPNASAYVPEHGQFRIEATVSEPLAVCRMLLKMGIELLGKSHYQVAASDRLLSAREFSRRPKRGSQWWFLLEMRPEEYQVSSGQHVEPIIEIFERDDTLMFGIQLRGISALTPLEFVRPPAIDQLRKDRYRIVIATC